MSYTADGTNAMHAAVDVVMVGRDGTETRHTFCDLDEEVWLEDFPTFERGNQTSSEQAQRAPTSLDKGYNIPRRRRRFVLEDASATPPRYREV